MLVVEEGEYVLAGLPVPNLFLGQGRVFIDEFLEIHVQFLRGRLGEKAQPHAEDLREGAAVPDLLLLVHLP